MWKKLLLAILLSGFFLFFGEKVSDFFMKRNPRLKSSYITEVEQNADILILGACEAEMMLDPELFERKTGYKTFNLGESGTRFADNYLYLYQYLKYQKRPKYLILHVSPESFYNADNKLLTTYLHQAFLSDTTVYNVIKELDPEYIRFSKIPFLKYSYYNIYSLYNIIEATGYTALHKKYPPSINGFVSPRPADTVDAFQTIINKVHGYKWSSTEEKYFRKIISLCMHEGIKPIFYKVPYYKGYYDANLFLRDYETKIGRIASENKIPYYVYDTSSLTKDYKNYFWLVNNLLSMKSIPTFNNMFIKDINDNVFLHDSKK